MKAVKTHVGRCNTCGKPATYKQILSGSRQFLFCDEHASETIKRKAAEAEEQAKASK
ncbi:hypothetical protein [Ktedonosporobacter rubrisoli]|uniref:hypothetical protein n=1 Tax=Ktedonosporobacter rubrisoli TaxID=2509675 RepID=UPI0013EE9CE9|nr:hypothetical protein [Ktedonosporobacter rubrisoli]